MRTSRRKKQMIAGLCISMMMASMSLFTAYGTMESETPYRVEDLKDAEDLIVVVGDGASKVMVSYYSKEQAASKKGPGETEDVWTEVFTTPGVYGKNGATSKKREGDGKTPTGTYSFTMAFGLKENPGSILPYHQIQKGDYWVDDSDSKYYNQLVNVNQTKKDWKSAEDMAASSPYYNYALALDYNKDQVPGAGSAIFIHCTKSEQDTGSQGCIRIPEELMKSLVQSVDEKTKIVIFSETAE